jgi:hypothetical protein
MPAPVDICSVMPGLVPGIHVLSFLQQGRGKDVGWPGQARSRRRASRSADRAEPQNTLLLAAFFALVNGATLGMAMKKLVVCVALALSLTSVAAKAAERAGDAALGALSGAVVLGPIGAVAGAVVGYTAGPHIARSWGLRRSAAHGGRRVSRQEAGAPVGDTRPAMRSQASMPAPPSAPKPNPAYAGPPAQGLD